MSKSEIRDFLTERKYSTKRLEEEAEKKGVNSDRVFVRFPDELSRSKKNKNGDIVSSKRNVTYVAPNRSTIGYESYRNTEFFKINALGDDVIFVSTPDSQFRKKVGKVTIVSMDKIREMLPEAKKRDTSKRELISKPEGATDVDMLISAFFKEGVEMGHAIESAKAKGKRGTREKHDKLSDLITTWNELKLTKSHTKDPEEDGFDKNKILTKYLFYGNRYKRDKDTKKDVRVDDEYESRLTGHWNVNLTPDREGKHIIKLQKYGIASDSSENLKTLVEKLNMMGKWDEIHEAYKTAKRERKAAKEGEATEPATLKKGALKSQE